MKTIVKLLPWFVFKYPAIPRTPLSNPVFKCPLPKDYLSESNIPFHVIEEMKRSLAPDEDKTIDYEQECKQGVKHFPNLEFPNICH